MISLLRQIRSQLGSGPDAKAARIRTEEMTAELSRADPIYLPSKFWTDLNRINTAQLSDDGFDNFKRTLNQNYFNWGPSSFEDNQLRNLLGHWQKAPSPVPVLAALEGDHRLMNMFNEDMLDTPEKARIYAFFVGLLWWFASTNDPDKLTATLSEPALGNPLRITLGERLISQDLANSVREYSAIRQFVPRSNKKPLSVAEIGAGYGRVGYVFLKALPCRYMIFDVPPALYISERYLSDTFPERKAFRFRHFTKFSEIESELQSADIGFIFTPNQIELFPNRYFDVAVSISALHEMRQEQITNFLQKIDQLTSGVVYLKNWRNWHNTTDDVVIDESTFQLPPSWQLALDRVDPVQDMFSEKVFVRRS